MKKLPLVLLCFCLLFLAADKIYKKKTRYGLKAKFASPTFAVSTEWELPPLSQEEQMRVDQILSQKFTYFARGSQAYAFISEDGKYILKMFYQDKWHPRDLLSHIPLSFNPGYRDYLMRKKAEKSVLSSCKAALLHAKEDVAVLFAHLNPSALSLPPIELVDRAGKTWKLDLDKSCFLLQKKAELFYPHIQDLMEKEDVEGAKYAITSTFRLLNRFLETGVFENNAILRKNFGFIDNEAIQFDIGKFKFDPTHIGDREEIRILTAPFSRWLKRNYPQLLSHFEQQLSQATDREISQ